MCKTNLEEAREREKKNKKKIYNTLTLFQPRAHTEFKKRE